MTDATSVAGATPHWAPAPTGEGRPNVVVIVLDDVGFGQLGCYGSSIATPNMDRLAAAGARYSNFHVAALCSPTRASLLTGRNHHAVGMGFLADFDTGFDGYRGTVSRSAATLAEMLAPHAYSSYAVGKWHLTPPSAMTQAGPFDSWPTGRGFDRYYGFLWGEDDQYAPDLWYDRHHVEPPDTDGYHLSEDLVDRAEEFVADHRSAAPDRPFYLHLAFGACHAPHQAPAEYLDRYVGRFDEGWDVERERVLAKQIALGVVPEGTDLPERNADVRPWADLGADEQRLFARMQEVFAGFMEHTDAQIGRLLDFLDETGLADDTVVMLLSDNGASGEGGANGSANEYRYFWGMEDTLAEAVDAMGDLGTPLTHNHYPTGWAQAGNTPLKMYKKFTFGGGVRAPLIIRWPGHIEKTDAVRRQFSHVTDIVPTILELLELEAPTEYAGVPQLPLHGTSLAYSLASPEEASRRGAQYFETAGNRGIYRDGFKLVSVHENGADYADDRWELYDLTTDYSEAHDLAGERPDLVAELVDLWWAEARRNGVLPLDDRMQTRVTATDPAAERSEYRLFDRARIPNGTAAPNFGSRPFRLVASIAPFGEGDEGVLVAFGRRAAGFSLFVRDGLLCFDLNLAGRHTVVTGPPVPVGTTELSAAVRASPEGAVCDLQYDGEVVRSVSLPSLMPAGLGTLTLQVGHNSPSPVSSRYASPFAWTGTLRDVRIRLEGVPSEPVGAVAAALASE